MTGSVVVGKISHELRQRLNSHLVSRSYQNVDLTLDFGRVTHRPEQKSFLLNTLLPAAFSSLSELRTIFLVSAAELRQSVASRRTDN
jgi:hypothetical protein